MTDCENRVWRVFQCSFLPRFNIYLETKYENNAGTTENVSILQADQIADFRSVYTFYSHRRSFILSLIRGLDHVEGASTGFMVASGGVLSEGCGHGGPGVCLGDGQTEAEGVPSQGGRGDALLRRMPSYLT